MAERVWTPAQRLAIDARGQDILVSAAAGSGKTAVLTERIIERITAPENPLSVDELLVVTYTKAAANELKTRIRGAILDELSKSGGKNRRLRRQLLLLEQAEISTIHSFCLNLIRKNAALLSLPANMRVADEGEAKRIAHEVMERLLADLYKEADPEFLLLTSTFAVLGDDQLTDDFLGLYEKTTSLPEGVEYFARSARAMEECIGKGILHGEIGKLLIGYLEAFFDHYQPFYGRLESLYPDLIEAERRELVGLTAKKEIQKIEKRILALDTQRAFFEAEWTNLSSVRAHYTDYDNLAAAMDKVVFASKPALRNAPEELTAATSFRDDCKKEFLAMRERYFPASRREMIDADIGQTARLLYALSHVMTEFDHRYGEEKRRHGLLDYADLEQYTHRLLVRDGEPTLAAKAVSLCYREIYIDEYQDVNRVQDEIFSAIAKANRFMVGDIKQSIYAFRGAEPAIFADYRSRFDLSSAETGQGQTIFLSHNFRCDQSVVDFVNLVCGDLFLSGGTVLYEEGDRLIRGKKDESDAHIPVEVVLLQADASAEGDEEDDSLAGGDAEAAYVAGEILRLWKDEKIPLSEMAVLLRSVQSRLDAYEKAFKANGIPYIHSQAMPFFEEPEVLTVLSLLHTIENPTQDIHLAGALTGPVFGFTLDELIDIRWREGHPKFGESLYEVLSRYKDGEGKDDQRIGAFFAWLEKYREASCTLSSDELIRKLYAETSMIAIVGADPLRGQAAKQNLRSFYQLARTYEKNSFRGLHRFLRYVQDLSDREQGVERKAEAGDMDAVRIMTIHQSKGLEFRVCFLADTAKDFNKRDATAPFLFHRDKGLTLTLRDSSTLGKYQTLPRQIFSKLVKESAVEEEMRVLYVALTRAKERLYTVAWLKNPESAEKRWQKLADHYSFYGVNTSAHYIDWIMATMKKHPELSAECAKIRWLAHTEDGFSETVLTDEAAAEESVGASVAKDSAETEIPAESAELVAPIPDTDAISARFDYEYPYSMVSDLPAKLTVSRLTPDILDTDEEDGENLQAPTMISAPSFLQNVPRHLTGAARGIATHTFMQFCDFAEVEKNGVEGELLRLVSAKFMTSEMAEAVNRKAVRQFFASDLYRQMRGAKEIRREFRFNVELPACEFTRDEERSESLADAKLLVQGVVDCCFTLPDGSLKLIDYKTDRLGADPAEGAKLLWERYQNQLFYYKKALELIFGKKVSQISLYSFHHSQEFSADESMFESVS